MIYISGDLHGNIDKAKLNTKNFPAQREILLAYWLFTHYNGDYIMVFWL